MAVSYLHITPKVGESYTASVDVASAQLKTHQRLRTRSYVYVAGHGPGERENRGGVRSDVTATAIPEHRQEVRQQVLGESVDHEQHRRAWRAPRPTDDPLAASLA
jgi:hypothetical protein